MKYFKSDYFANLWNLSPRSVRNYCSQGRIVGAYLEGKTWMIPDNASKPSREKRHTKELTLLKILKAEKNGQIKGGIYHKLQIEMTYNSNHIEGSKLTHDETKFIFDTKTIGLNNEPLLINDILETINHFRCIDIIIDFAERKLTESLIKQLHFILKSGTTDSTNPYFKIGDYKIFPNEVGDTITTPPENVKREIQSLLRQYNEKNSHTLNEIIDFHVRFEKIHPFHDGNGRIGRLIAFKECLKNNIVPFIILDTKKLYYYRGLKNWNKEKGWLIDTCLDGQDIVKTYLDYFKIKYKEN